jgi:N-carbamoyl-L-amino-acid hydrolase
VVELVNKTGLDNAPIACATVGMMSVYPNSRNVIPGQVFMTIDIRHPDDDVLTNMDAAIREGIAKIASNIGLEADLSQIFYYAPVTFDKSCIDAVRRAAEDCGYTARDIVSGAGHDACYMAQIAPTSMVFVPCIDGISHNEVENAKPAWLTAGCDVLLRAMLNKAGHHS